MVLGFFIIERSDRMIDKEERVPNEITMAAIHEGDEMLKNGTGKSHTFSSGMFNRILEEDNEE
jgi:hypothetical protein